MDLGSWQFDEAWGTMTIQAWGQEEAGRIEVFTESLEAVPQGCEDQVERALVIVRARIVSKYPTLRFNFGTD